MKAHDLDNKIYETSMLLVYHNDSGEVFIKHKQSGHELRIKDYLDEIMIIANKCILTPTNLNGVSGIKTYPKQVIPFTPDHITCKRCGAIISHLEPCPNCESGF